MEPALCRAALWRLCVFSVTLAAVAWLLCSGAVPAAAAPAAPKYVADMAAFMAEVDKTYPFLDLKGIRADWSAAKMRLTAAAGICRSDTDFLGLVLEAIRCLRDAHMDLGGLKTKAPERPPLYYPGVSFLPAVGNAVVVMVPPPGNETALPVGTVVTEIDGKNARQVLDDRAKAAWAKGGSFSSPQRAHLLEYRLPLTTPAKGEQHRITYLAGRMKKTVVLAAAAEARGWPHAYNLPANLVGVGRSFSYARLPSGVGYMYIRRADESTGPGMAEALAKVAGAKGWIVDLRGNGGGGYDEAVLKTLQGFPKPVAVLIDAGCISAGETLARDFARNAGARLFGTATAGSSSSKRQWAFPSGIASVTFSVRSRWRADGKPIEFNGIEPDVPVEEVPAEMARGQNSGILRAEEYLLKKP
jgi:hypothetical protein